MPLSSKFRSCDKIGCPLKSVLLFMIMFFPKIKIIIVWESVWIPHFLFFNRTPLPKNMNHQFLNQLYTNHIECCRVPSRQLIASFFERLLGMMFPEQSDIVFSKRAQFDTYVLDLKESFYEMIDEGPNNAEEDTKVFFEALPSIYDRLVKDAQAMLDGDPAAKSLDEVIRAYPGFYSIAAYRVSHQLVLQEISVIPRTITEIAHSKTGIDIHPGATIGEYFCIDHGTGIVIGETTHIGNHVKIYQGVTLGALSVDKKDANIKRHPTIEDHVVIYAGATILGGDTVIGHHSIIGGNVWIVKSVAAESKVYYKRG